MSSSAESVLKVLDYTKTNKKWFDDKDLVAGYHTVSILGKKFKGQRDPEIRLKKMDYDFTGKRVLDVGCSNGGLLHALTEDIKFGVGVDFNAKCINAANALKAINCRNNIHFYTFDLDKEDLSMLNHFVLGEQVDVCFFFNISLWVKRWKDVFSLCANLSRTIIFEAHGNDAQQEAQLQYVKSIYQNVSLLSEQSDDDPTYAKRKMYLCEEKHEKKILSLNVDESGVLTSYDEPSIKSAYAENFPNEEITSFHVFPNTHESVVVDVNGDYIIKLPRQHRGADGLRVEQSVTDFMRSRIQLPIPDLSVCSEAVLMARYRKLQGTVFNKTRYKDLSEKVKSDIAGQMADFIAAFHSVDISELNEESISLSPSWKISTVLITEQLSSEDDAAIKALCGEVVSNHEALKVPESHKVFGHFDLHGGNVLVNKPHDKITAVVDFGNCKVGDLHQDLSSMNLSSPDLAERIINDYERKTSRKVNRLLVQHYTTIFYLNLLAGLKRKKADKQYDYWLKELNTWYDHLLMERARLRVDTQKKTSAIPDGWKKWISSNLMKGSSHVGLQKVLREQGFSHLDIATEILLAQEHPYTKAGAEIFHTLNKRNWLMRTCDTLASLDERYASKLEVRPTPSFDVFIKEYYSKHLPVVLTHGIDHWPALKKWTPEYIKTHFGEKTIEAQFGREADPLYERNAGKHKTKMLMKDFVNHVVNGGESNDYYMTANNTKNSLSGIEEIFQDVADFGEGYREKDSIHSENFFWFGPKHVFTPMHHDLTNNMLVQIYGRKKVTMIPALQVPWMYNDTGVFSAADYPSFDEKRHPLMKNITPTEVILNPGDSIFIPIGWWHCVEALDVSISISFTNFNAPNRFSVDFPR